MEIYVNDWNARLDIINTFKSLQWIRRSQSAGEFTLRAPLTAENLSLLQEGRLLTKSDDPDMMIIDIVNIVDGNKEKLISCFGRSGVSLLDRRIVRVDNNTQKPLMRGEWSDIVLTMLSRHAINPIDTRRALPVIYDPAPGLPAGVIEKSVSWRKLGEALCRLCRQYGLGIRTRWKDGVLSVQPYPLRVNPVVFSKQWGTLDEEERLISIREFATDAIVGGAGEFPNRIMSEVSSNLSGFDLFERFVDVSSELRPEDYEDAGQYMDSLTQAGRDALLDSVRQDEYTASTTASSMEYKVDYDVGDIVNVRSSFGFEAVRLISEVTETYDRNGRTLDPKFEPLTFEEDDNGSNLAIVSV